SKLSLPTLASMLGLVHAALSCPPYLRGNCAGFACGHCECEKYRRRIDHPLDGPRSSSKDGEWGSGFFLSDRAREPAIPKRQLVGSQAGFRSCQRQELVRTRGRKPGNEAGKISSETGGHHRAWRVGPLRSNVAGRRGEISGRETEIDDFEGIHRA